MDAIETYLAMGGKAAFIWPAYGITLVVLGWLVADSLRRLRQARDAVAALERARPRRARRR
jgi:heme exporter protein D